MKLLPDVVGDRIELSLLKYQPHGGSQYQLKLAEQLVGYELNLVKYHQRFGCLPRGKCLTLA